MFAPTAAYLYDCAGFLTSWLKDLAADQTPAGVVPLYVPRVDLSGPFSEPIPQAGWGDAAVLVPWVVYQRFGDVDVLRRQYRGMRAWVDWLTATLGAGNPILPAVLPASTVSRFFAQAVVEPAAGSTVAGKHDGKPRQPPAAKQRGCRGHRGPWGQRGAQPAATM